MLPEAREGSRLGHAEMVDTMIHDGLWSTFTRQHMGESSDAVNAELGIGRQEQDAWAARSHQRANAGWESGALADEVVPVEVPQRTGDAVLVERDEGIRADSTPESLAALKPAFAEGGTITAGNASQISDGAAALVVTSPEKAEQLGLQPLAEIVAHGMSAERFPYLHTVPAIALQNALKKADLDVHDLGLLEVNEAFAAVSLHVTQAPRVRRGARERQRRRGRARAPDRRERGPSGRSRWRMRCGAAASTSAPWRSAAAAARATRWSSGATDMKDLERFELPEELEEFRALVRQIADERIAPRAAEIDETDEWPEDVYKVLVEHDLMGVGYPEEHGGSGGGSLAFGVLHRGAVARLGGRLAHAARLQARRDPARGRRRRGEGQAR